MGSPQTPNATGWWWRDLGSEDGPDAVYVYEEDVALRWDVRPAADDGLWRGRAYTQDEVDAAVAELQGEVDMWRDALGRVRDALAGVVANRDDAASRDVHEACIAALAQPQTTEEPTP